jgi:hypothetical protein
MEAVSDKSWRYACVPESSLEVHVSEIAWVFMMTRAR